MILLYTLLLLLVGAAHWMLQRRAGALGRTYQTRAEAVLMLLGTSVWKPGNGKHDVCAQAKHQFELGQLAFARDRAEAKYYKAQAAADKFGKWLAAAKSWKGKKLPYTMGACDVWLILYVIDRLGVADLIGPGRVIETIVALWTK